MNFGDHEIEKSEISRLEQHIKILFPYVNLNDLVINDMKNVLYSKWPIYVLGLTWTQALKCREMGELDKKSSAEKIKTVFIDWVETLLPINVKHGFLKEDWHGDFVNAETYRMYLTWIKALNFNGDVEDEAP